MFTRGVYSNIKERVKSQGVANIPPADMGNFFSPFFAEHVGAIKVGLGMLKQGFLGGKSIILKLDTAVNTGLLQWKAVCPLRHVTKLTLFF